MLATVMRIQVGGQVVEGSGPRDFVGVVRHLSGEIATKHRDFFAARVLLGHVLGQLRDRLSPMGFDALVEEAGVHRRRVSEAMRLAQEVGGPNGEVDWARYRQLVGEGSQPSVRAVIARAQQRDYHLRHSGTPSPEESIELVDADEGEEVELVDADAFDGDPQFSGSAGTRVRDRSADVREEGLGGRAHVSGGGEEPAARVSAGEVGEQARVSGVEVGERTRASGAILGEQTRASAADKGAAGEQLGLGELYDQAERQLQALERTLQLLGVDDAGSLLVAVRDRIRH